MRGAALAAVLLALLSSGARADDPPAQKKPFKASFIGEGGGYTHPDKATQDYMEGDLGAGAPARPEPAKPSPAAEPAATPRPAPPPPPSPASAVPSAAPRRAVSAPVRAARSAADRPAAPAAGAPRPDSRPSLWNGLVSPLEMTSASAGGADPDAARASGDRDYETHILGLKGAASRPSLGAPAAPAAPAPPAASSDEAPRLFVSLEIDPREAGTLRDAVAGLGAAAGFSADARFEPMLGPGGSQLLSGWMPASRLADALRRPGVKRLRVETRPRPSPARPTASDFVVGLRVDDPARAQAAVDAGAADLARAAGFKLARVVGLETAPDGRSVAVVVGRLPLSSLGRVLARPEVAKIAPLRAEAPSAPAPAGPAGFARFAVRRGLWLILLTLALALPSLRDAARRLATAFVPYR